MERRSVNLANATYMGKVSPVDYMQTEIKNDKGQKLPIMNFKMKLEHSVREDIYEYFVD